MQNAWSQLRQGDLAALFYTTRQQQLAFAIPYLIDGLEKRERCLYIADDISVPLILRRLEQADVDLGNALKSGALRVLTKHETYLRAGEFDPEVMASDLQEEVKDSLRCGYAGFRGSGDMSWAFEIPSGVEKMIQYQRILAENFPSRFLAVCQYDETKFTQDVLAQMRHLHTVIIREGIVERSTGSSIQIQA